MYIADAMSFQTVYGANVRVFSCCSTGDCCNAFIWDGHPSKVPLPWGISTPFYYMVSWAHSSLCPKRHVNRFSRFCRVHKRDQQTDSQD